jgi:hypothetical protein
MRVLAIAMTCAVGLSPTAFAESRLPTELQCEFGPFVSAVAPAGSRYFTTETYRATDDDNITFFNMNLASRSARAEGNNVDSGQVIFDAWDATWTFTEYTYRGDIYVTQVFREDEPGADKHVYRVVRSRQWTEFGNVFATQHYGLCLAIY